VAYEKFKIQMENTDPDDLHSDYIVHYDNSFCYYKVYRVYKHLSGRKDHRRRQRLEKVYIRLRVQLKDSGDRGGDG